MYWEGLKKEKISQCKVEKEWKSCSQIAAAQTSPPMNRIPQKPNDPPRKEMLKKNYIASKYPICQHS